MTPIPVPVRRRILQLYERGKSTREIAQFFGFCVAAVRRLRQQLRQRDTLQPRTQCSGRCTLLTQERKQRLQELLSEQPDATLAELGTRMDRPFRTSTVDLWLRQMGWKYEKTLVAAEQNRPDVAEKRARWHEQLAAEPLTGLVFVDESGANTQMTRWRGRALGGRRLVAHVPHGSYQTSTLISGIRWEDPCAPWLFEGPMNGEIMSIDSRPSDALALALRVDCPIFVEDEVLKSSKISSAISEKSTSEELRKWLEGLSDEDLGRYKM